MPEARQPAAAKRLPTQGYQNTIRKRTTPLLPPQIQSSVPSCGQLCLSYYVERDYNCPNNDFSCLCRQYSSQGFTLGELAYLCLKQDCAQASQAESKSAYFVCGSQAGAVPATHSTLTLPATTASPVDTSKTSSDTAPTFESSKAQIQPQRPTSRIPASSRTSAPARTNTAMSDATDPSTAHSASLSTSSGAATPSALHATHLTGGQSAGISIAAMGTVIFAIAAIYFIIWLRRRRVTHKDERKSYDFVDEAPPRFSPFNYGYADPRGPLGGFHDRRAELMTEKRNSNWYRSRFGDGSVPRYEKQNDVSPNSYGSNDTKRTLSQLLPDKPGLTFSRTLPKSPAPSAATFTTVFEEDQPPVPPVKPLPGLPRDPRPGQAIHYPPPVKQRKPLYAQQSMRPAMDNRQPPLSLAIPRQAARPPRIPSPLAFPLPPNMKGANTESEQHVSNSARARSRDSDGSVLNYYASPEAGYTSSPEVDSPTPIEVEVQKRKPVPNAITVTKPTYPPRAVRVNSAGSDTSFESNVDDEPTPPEELERHLTPVVESPIAGIRYPKVPRSSNQAVPRSPGPKVSSSGRFPPPPVPRKRPQPSPKYDTAVLPIKQQQQQQRRERQPDPVTPKRQDTTASNLSGSTLAAKRLGSTAAHDLERRLHLTDSSRANSHATGPTSKSEPNSSKSRRSDKESPLKGYGRVASGGRKPSREQVIPEKKSPHLWSPGLPGQTQHVSMKSPLWEPKLTPSRKGEDLYLSVGTATPRTAGFTPMTESFARAR